MTASVESTVEHQTEISEETSTERPPEKSGMVVGLDGSVGSEHALAWAVERTDRFGPIRPITAWQYPAWAVSDPMLGSRLALDPEDFAASARHQIDETLCAVADASQLEPVVVRSPPGPALVGNGADAELIVVGTRGRGAIVDRLLGSVSCYVVSHALVPVAVVPLAAAVEPSLDGQPRRVVAGVDGSENSIRALAWAIASAEEDAVVEAIHVWSLPVGGLPEPYVFSSDTSEQAAEQTLAKVVDEAKELAGRPDADVVARLEYGDPREVLRRLSTDAEMLVLGAQGHHGVAHLLLGSVTTGLIHQPVVATVVVPAHVD